VTIPKAQDIAVRHQAACAVLTVPAVAGCQQLVEFKQVGSDWEPASQHGTEWIVPLAQPAGTEFRARYVQRGECGEWTTGRARLPDGFKSGGDPTPGRPCVPHGLQNFWDNPFDTELSWSQHGEVDRWHVIASGAASRVDACVTRPQIAIADIPYGQDLQVKIAAVRDSVESGQLTARLSSAHYVPATPIGLVVTPGDGTLDLAWVQPDMCEHWQVVWHETEVRRRNPQAAAGGTQQVFGSSRYRIADLKCDIEYDLLITSRWRRSGYSTASARATARTTGHSPSVTA
jgi:hypothetical protein